MITNPIKLHYIYYHCTKRKNKNCTQRSVNLSVLEKQIADFLSGIEIKQEYVDWAIKHLQKNHSNESNSRQAVQVSQQKAFNDASLKLDKLLEMRLRDELSETEYLAKKSALMQEKEGLQGLLQDTDGPQNLSIKQAEEVFTFAQKARAEFETATLQRKKIMVNTFCSKPTLKAGILALSAYEPFKIIQQALIAITEAKVLLETKNSPINKRRTPSFEVIRPLWLSLLEKLRTFFKENCDAEF